LDRIVLDVGHPLGNFQSWLNLEIPQVKARPFEILGCKAFLISGYADNMNDYYENGKEIVYFDGTGTDLAEKIRYYLDREALREKIAEAGYARTLKEHTYERRFKELFHKIGLNI
jgi:spore maturation protein CgeB